MQSRWIKPLPPVKSISEPLPQAQLLQDLESSLRQREHELAEAYRIARLGSWSWDVLTDVVEWSSEVYRTFEADPSRPAPDYAQVPKLHSPESQQRLQAAVSRALELGEPYELDLELVMPSGKTRWITARGEVESTTNGRPTRLRGTIQDITERKRSEQKLALSETRYRSLIRASSEIVWTTTPDGNQTDQIPEWQAFTGQSDDEVLGFGWADAIHPEDRANTVAAWRHSLSTGEKFEVVQRLRRHDGNYFTMHVRAVPSRDANGNIVEWVGMHTDITQRKLAEDALRQSESRFHKLFQSNLMGICIPDRYGAFHEGNDEFLRIVGYTRQDLEAGLVRWDTMTPPEYTEADRWHIAEAAERGSCTPYEKEYLRKDGRRVPILCGYALLEKSQDLYIGFVLDMTQLKQTEEELRVRERRFREMAQALPQLIWETDSVGNPLYQNQRFAEYTGIPPEQLLAEPWKDYIHPADLDATAARWSRAVETGEPYLAEVRLRRHDGAFRTFLSRANPVRTSDGTIDRWIGTATDIHEQKIAEDALRRTEKLATAGRLAASMAHEINNPLSAVTNSVYLALRDPNLSPATHALLAMAEQELARVAHVTTQTLRFHQQSSAATATDLGEVMDAALALFASRFRQKGISVQRDYRPHAHLLCHSEEVRQVFANLLSNALDATRSGGTVRIRIAQRTATQGTATQGTAAQARPGIRVLLADTGEGIPADMLRQVFEPFVSTKELTGTGLGLYVSQGIVEKHNGSIRLRSRTQPDRHGTVFSLFFPYTQV